MHQFFFGATLILRRHDDAIYENNIFRCDIKDWGETQEMLKMKVMYVGAHVGIGQVSTGVDFIKPFRTKFTKKMVKLKLEM
jgi:hypothetical protein